MKKLMLTLLVIFVVLMCVPAVATDSLTLTESETREQIETVAINEMGLLSAYFSSSGEPNYPDYYAGTYMDDSGGLVICVTDDSLAVKELIYSIIGSDSAIIKKVQYSYNQLQHVSNLISNYYVDAYETDEMCKYLVGVGISEKENSISVMFSAKDADTKAACLKKLLEVVSHDEKTTFSMEMPAINIIDADSFEFGPTESNAADTHEELNENNTGAERMITDYYLSGGVRFYDEMGSTSYGIMSVGFPCKYNSAYGFVTAGHGTLVDGAVKSVGGKMIGYTSKRVRQGSIDAAFVATNAESNIETRISTRYNGEPLNMYLTGTAVATTGSSIYKSGYASHCTKGSVVYSSYTVLVEGVQISDCIVSDYSSEEGDSGGPVYTKSGSNAKLLGIHMAHNDQGYSVTCKVSNIVNELGITLTF